MSSRAPTDGRPAVVLLDVGGVLIQLRSFDEAFALEEMMPDPSERREWHERFLAFKQSEVFAGFEQGRVGFDEFLGAARAAFPVTDLDDEEITRRYRRIIGPDVPGMPELVEDLTRVGVRVAALSDTSHVHLDEFRTRPWCDRLERVFASCETGRLKPAPETFLHAVDELGVTPGEVLFTDDVERNVLGAREAGLRAEVFRGPDALREQLALPSTP